jgi:hypothetical protein
MADLGETARNKENENSLEQQVLDIMTAVHEAVAAGVASEEYIKVQNQAVNALLEGKRIVATAIADTSRSVVGYNNTVFRWVPTEAVTTVQGIFKSAEIQAGRINLFQEKKDRIKSPYDKDEQVFWDVTIINSGNRNQIEQVAEINVEDVDI